MFTQEQNYLTSFVKLQNNGKKKESRKKLQMLPTFEASDNN